MNFLAVAIVIALLFGAAWALKRSTSYGKTSKSLTVETGVSLGERRSLVIVSVEGRRLLLGLTPAQISLVAELDE